MHRIAWDLRGEAPNASGGGRGGRGGAGSDSPDARGIWWPWTSERSAGHTWQISCDDRKNDWRYRHPDRPAPVVCGGAAAKLAGRPRHGDAQDYPVTRIVMRSLTAPFAFAAEQFDLILAGDQPRERQTELRYARRAASLASGSMSRIGWPQPFRILALT